MLYKQELWREHAISNKISSITKFLVKLLILNLMKDKHGGKTILWFGIETRQFIGVVNISLNFGLWFVFNYSLSEF